MLDSKSCRVMYICQSVYAIAQYIPLVVKGTQTELRHLYRVVDVIRRSYLTKSAHCIFAGVLQNLQKLVMAYMFQQVNMYIYTFIVAI